MKKYARSLEFDPSAFEDLAWWVENDRKRALKIIKLIKDIQEVLEVVISVIKSSLADKETIKITGFGTFTVKKRGVRKGRNLKTGEEITLEPKWAVSFKASQHVKDAVKGVDNDTEGS